MPQQVWQTEDGTIFESEIEAIRYEESDELFRNFYDDKGRRKEQLPDISHLRGDFGTAISARLMQMVFKESPTSQQPPMRSMASTNSRTG